MEQTQKAKELTRKLRTDARLLGASARARDKRLMHEAADMIDALLAGSALSHPAEDGVVLGAKDTSREAALRVFPRTGTQRARVLDIISASISGLTDEEMQNILSMSPNSQRPRRNELVKGGWVEDSGKQRKTKSGAFAEVWTLTHRGKAHLNA